MRVIGPLVWRSRIGFASFVFEGRGGDGNASMAFRSVDVDVDVDVGFSVFAPSVTSSALTPSASPSFGGACSASTRASAGDASDEADGAGTSTLESVQTSWGMATPAVEEAETLDPESVGFFGFSD